MLCFVSLLGPASWQPTAIQYNIFHMCARSCRLATYGHSICLISRLWPEIELSYSHFICFLAFEFCEFGVWVVRLEIHFYSLLWAILQNFLSFLWSVGGQLETSDRKMWVHAACTKQLTRPDYIGIIGTIHHIPNNVFFGLGVYYTSAGKEFEDVASDWSDSHHNWLVVYLHLWKIWARQLGWWHPQLIWENKSHVPNHQPVISWFIDHRWP